jgi:hypothetical protein
VLACSPGLPGIAVNSLGVRDWHNRLPESGTGSRYGCCDDLGQKDVLGFEMITKAGLRKSRFAHEFNEAQIVDAALPEQPRRNSDDGVLVSCHLPL